jgi:hypothetical protein
MRSPAHELCETCPCKQHDKHKHWIDEAIFFVRNDRVNSKNGHRGGEHQWQAPSAEHCQQQQKGESAAPHLEFYVKVIMPRFDAEK